jgi:tripartite-type tricarboxylate transporter receptor subunit TctC
MRGLIVLALASIAFISGSNAWGQAASTSSGQAYPSRPIRLVLPIPPGGSPDVIARTLARQIEIQLGQNIIVDNRAGANGIIASVIVAKAAPDGYTVLHTPPSHILNALIYKQLQYDVFKDFIPVTNVASGVGYLLLVNPSLPAHSVRELIALAKEKSLAYGSPPAGNTLHLATELFNVRAGTQLRHIPYKGGSETFNALISGEVQVLFVPPTAAMPYVKAGRLRALGFSGSKRFADLPDVPTIAEAGVPDYVVDFTWNGWFAPARTPAAIINRLQAEVHQALQAPKVREVLAASAFYPVGSTPEEFRKFIQDEMKRYAEIVREAKIPQQ